MPAPYPPQNVLFPTGALALALALTLALPSLAPAGYRNYNLPCLAPLLLQMDPDAPKTVEEAFIAGPTHHPAPLDGIGQVDFPITTNSPEAQASFNQGVALLHGLWYSEAERNFRMALDLDPGNPMALWGLAMANELRPGRARTFADAAVRSLRPDTSPREKQWIEILAHYFQVGRNLKFDQEDTAALEAEFESRHRQYIHDLENLILAHPDDLEAKAFLVRQLALAQHRLGVPIGSRLTIDHYAQQIAETAPLHPSRHYLIFLWLTENPALALPAAAVSPALAPAIADSWRYAAEAHQANQQYNEAVPLLQATLRVNHRYLHDRLLMPEEMQNLTANYIALVENLAAMGRINDALALAEQMISFPRASFASTAPSPQSLKNAPYATGRRLFVQTLMRAELWERLLDSLEQDPALQPGSALIEQARSLYWKGVAQAHLDRPDDARASQQELSALLDAAARSNLPSETDEEIASLLEGLDTLLKFQSGQAVTAIPDDPLPYLPAETAARLFFKSELKNEAIALVKDNLEDHPGQILPTAAYCELQFAAADQVAAMYVFTRTFRADASQADPGLPILSRLQPIADAMQLGSRWKLGGAPASPPGAPADPDALGPLAWSPPPAPAWTLPNHAGREISLDDFQGQPIMLNFFLGVGCVYCAEQLNKFRPHLKDFEAAGITMVAVSSDSVEALAQALGDSEELDEETRRLFPFPVLADPDYKVFQQYGAYDDFEQGGMHATVIIDAQGRQLWSNISHAPFKDPIALLEEAKRLLALHDHQEKTESP